LEGSRFAGPPADPAVASGGLWGHPIGPLGAAGRHFPGGTLKQTDCPLPAGLPGADCCDLSAPSGHRFAVVVIRFTIFWFVHLHISCRAVCGVWLSLQLLLGLPGPSHQTVCTWALRVGLFLLQRRHPGHPDWVFVIDSTLRLGDRKCLVILGARLADLAALDGAPTPRDFVTLDVAVTGHAGADFVKRRVESVCERVGAPRQIVSDHSGEFTAGVRLVQEDHPGVVATYDISHKLCCLLEAQLQADPRWLAFLKGCSACLPRLQQTPGAFLKPPALRTMARYMHVSEHVEWAEKVLGVLDRQDVAVLAEGLGVPQQQASQWLEARLGWLREYRQDLEQYGQLLRVSQQVQAEVKNNGLSRRTPEVVEERFAAEMHKGRWQAWWGRLVAYLKAEAGQVPEEEVWLGSSDVIESLFGQYKNATGQGPFPEIGRNVLLLPVLTTELSDELIRTGLETVKGTDVEQWVQQTIGPSTLAKIHRVLRPPETATPDPEPPHDPTTIEHEAGTSSGE
jgi:hypothetical protein